MILEIDGRHAVRQRRTALMIGIFLGFVLCWAKLTIWPRQQPLAVRLQEEGYPLPYLSWMPDSIWLDSLTASLTAGGALFLMLCMPYALNEAWWQNASHRWFKLVLGFSLLFACMAGFIGAMSIGFYPAAAWFLLLSLGGPAAAVCGTGIFLACALVMKAMLQAWRSIMHWRWMQAIIRWRRAEGIPDYTAE